MAGLEFGKCFDVLDWDCVVIVGLLGGDCGGRFGDLGFYTAEGGGGG